MEGADNLIRNINRCFVVKLARNYDEVESHSEITTRNNNLSVNIKAVLDGLEKVDLKKSLVDDTAETVKGSRIAIISAVLNLYRELLCDCPWNTPNSKECAKKLNRTFKNNCEIQIGDVLKTNDVCDSQTVFDKVLDHLCIKLTAVDFKKFPGQVEVYCYLVQNCINFDVTVQALKILPFTLVLIDDYIVDNKIKGLKCCQALLQTLTSEDFSTGNYYDVIYISVKNCLNQKDIKVTELSHACLWALCEIIPSAVKDEKLDELYSESLEQINTESNLHRKAAFFRFAKRIVQTLQIKCVGKSLFKPLICDNVESCLTPGVAEILLVPCLECLEQWLKYCWPVWKLPVDFRILCALLKLFSQSDTEQSTLCQKIIVTLIALCSPDEQKQFVAKLSCKDLESSKIGELLMKDIGI